MYIITGGAGFIGSALVWELNRKGIYDIIVVDNHANTEKWKNLVGKRFTNYYHKSVFLDLLHKGTLKNIDGIVHLGACSSTTERDADYLMENNLHYSMDLCTYALEHGIRFLNASSAATYGDGSQGFDDDIDTIYKLKPLNMYGLSKQLFDLWTLEHGYQHSIASFKFFNVYGPNEYHKEDMRSVVLKTFLDIMAGKSSKLFKSYKAEYKDGEQMRDFIYIKDIVYILYTFLSQPTWNGIFNIGTGVARTWNDLIHAVYVALGKECRIEYIDMPQHLKEKYQYYTKADTTHFMRVTKNTFSFTSLEDGVTDYVQNYLMHNCAVL